MEAIQFSKFMGILSCSLVFKKIDIRNDIRVLLILYY